MILQFIEFYIFEAARSSIWQKKLIINIVLGLVMLYLMASFLMLGFMLDRVISEIVPGSNPVEALNGILLYYVGFEILIRFFMQHTPAMNMTPFMHLPVRRSFLMHFLLIRGTVSLTNYLAFFIFVPFAIKNIAPVYSGAAVCSWLLALFMLATFANYAVVYIKRQMVVKFHISLVCGLVYAALFALDYFHIFSLSALSSTLFEALLLHPLYVLVPIVLAASVYLLNYRFLMAHIYPEEINRTVRKRKIAQGLGFMSRFGQIGELIGLELKLMSRHKRTKTLLYMAPVFLFYGMIFYPNPLDNLRLLIFVGIFISGVTMLSYGQYIVAWEGAFFDGTLTRNSSLYNYLQAKYILLATFCIICYILTTPYVFYGTNILLINTACALFNIGVNGYIMLWFAQYNRKKIELSQGAAMNWQGVGASQFIVGLPTMLLPILIVQCFAWAGLTYWGVGVLALLGIAGIACHKPLIRMICQRFIQAKYPLAEGFRQK